VQWQSIALNIIALLTLSSINNKKALFKNFVEQVDIDNTKSIGILLAR
jgi:hypothetical protein